MSVLLSKSKNLSKFLSVMTIGALLMHGMTAFAGTVTVSNYPLAMLSNAVTKGAESANVLLGAGDVGHHGSLSPAGKKLVVDSDYVVWFGAELEQNLVGTLKDAPNAISLFKFRAFHRLPLRNIDGTQKADTLDPHIWLDPQNAKAIVRALAVIHSHANPKNKDLYQKNAQEFGRQMDEVVKKTAQNGKPQPYWAYHDSYQYIEKALNIKFAGALTPDHHLAPKASQIRLLASTRPLPKMCLLSQAPVSEGIVNKLQNTNVLVKQEDMSDGKDFIQTWQSTAQEIYQCQK